MDEPATCVDMESCVRLVEGESVEQIYPMIFRFPLSCGMNTPKNKSGACF